MDLDKTSQRAAGQHALAPHYLGPTLYRANAFRLAGLPVEASSQDLRRRAEALRVSASLNTPPPAGFEPLPPISPPPPEDVRDALQRLVDPETRVMEELFWFWPSGSRSRDDAALQAMVSGDYQAACQDWRRPSASAVGLHNLAVLSHCMALDHEIDNARDPDGLDADDLVYVERLWRQALLDWSAVQADDAFWAKYADRLTQFDDPRLTPALALRTRRSLPAWLLSINARLAVLASERGLLRDRARHLSLVRRDGVDTVAANDALRDALAATRQRVTSECQAAIAETESANEHGATVADRLLASSASLVSALDTLPSEHPVRESGRDEIAGTVLRCQVMYGNKTDDWERSLDLLTRARDIAAGTSTRQDLDKNIDIVRRNLEHAREVGVCWFCGDVPPVAAVSVKVEMHGDVTRTPTFSGVNVNWRHTTVQVPRCSDCRRRHGRGAGIALLTFLLTSGTGVSYCAAGNAEGVALGAGWVSFIASFFVAAWADRRARGGIKNESEAKQFGAVRRLVAQGWSFGAKPPGVN